MTTETLDVKRRGAISTLFAALTPALISLPLCLSSGCVADDASTSTTTQGLGASCTVWRPYAWSGAANACYEGTFSPRTLTLLDGQSATFHSVPGPGMGQGEVRIICSNGVFTQDPWDTICIPDLGGGGGILEP